MRECGGEQDTIFELLRITFRAFDRRSALLNPLCISAIMSQLYSRSGELLLKMQQHRSVGLKTLLFGSDKASSMGASTGSVYALVCETLKYLSIIKELLRKCKLDKLARSQRNRSVLYVLTYELLFGAGRIRGGGALKRALLEVLDEMKSALETMKLKLNAKENEELLPVEWRKSTQPLIGRFARVNTLVDTQKNVLESLRSQGFDVVLEPQTSLPNGNEVFVDRHIDNVLVFAPERDLHANELVTSSALILQDKASCFPAAILAPSPDSHIIDACAAPGNKTSHLVALMSSGSTSGSSGLVTAFERDPRRAEILKSRLAAAGAGLMAQTECGDFLGSRHGDPQFANVKSVLVDPSCSGSGLAHHRIENLLCSRPPNLQALQRMQVNIVVHAMKFPNVQRVVYSTCSINRKENEDVVSLVLQRCPMFELVPALPSFPGRGLESAFKGASMCVRTDPREHHTNGFFVALFVRRTSPLPAKEAGDAEIATDRDTVSVVRDESNRSKPRSKPKSLSSKRRKKRLRLS